MIAEQQPIPRVLEQRLRINDEHREVLRTLSAAAPADTGYLYLHDPKSKQVPTVEDVAAKLQKEPDYVRRQLAEIKSIWKIPDKLPTASGKITDEQALILALTNQHRLRFDPKINDYKDYRIHTYSAELGTGTLYSRGHQKNDRGQAFKGEMLFRQALGLDEMLNSQIFQGGVMPQIMSMYGKLKTERASLTGLDVTKDTYNQDELDELRQTLELAQRDPVTGKPGLLTERQINNLERFVVNTIDTMEQAGISVAHEIAPLFKNLPPEVPTHIFWSYNDDFNMEEIGDLLLSSMRLVRQKAKQAEETIPELELEHDLLEGRLARNIVNLTAGQHLLNAITNGDNQLKGKALRDKAQQLLGHKRIRERMAKNYLKYKPDAQREDVDSAVDDAVKRYAASTLVKSVTDIEGRLGEDEKRKESIKERLPVIKEQIIELRVYQKAYHAEQMQGHSWFTKHIAVNSTESKALRMVKKSNYRRMYDDYLFKELENILGRKPNIFLHTDREITIYIPEPAKLYGLNQYPDELLYGTTITSIPRVNRQASNEPTMNTLVQLQKRHESAVKARVAKQQVRPYTSEEFEAVVKQFKELEEQYEEAQQAKRKLPFNAEELDKHHGTAYSDVILTSWGAEGFHYQPKFVIAPTRIKGEYEEGLEIVRYIKLPTRHDMKVLTELEEKGNRGTWEIKRKMKGGPTTGAVYHVFHPDGSDQPIFVHDDVFLHIASKYGPIIEQLEQKRESAKAQEAKDEWQSQLGKVYQTIREDIGLEDLLLTNDLHFGAANLKGRPTNVDVARATQLVALQNSGLGGVAAAVGTEFLHGNQRWRSYDTSMEGELEDPVESDMKTSLLTAGLRKYFASNGVPATDIEPLVTDYLNAYKSEQLHSKSTFRPTDQVQMFRLVQKPVFDELLKNGKKVIIGSGNHWQGSIKGVDEATLLAQLFDLKYTMTEQLEYHAAHGQGFTFQPIKLPGGLNAMLTHKMWHGATEISVLADQALGHKEDAWLYLVADRHHTGMVVEREMAFVLDAGKQTTMPYVSIIGKASSTRGTVVPGYNKHGHKIVAARFYLDDVANTITGWPQRAEKLKTCHDVLGKEIAAYYHGER